MPTTTIVYKYLNLYANIILSIETILIILILVSDILIIHLIRMYTNSAATEMVSYILSMVVGLIQKMRPWVVVAWFEKYVQE